MRQKKTNEPGPLPQEGEERWRLLVENHPEPILIVCDDQICYCNPVTVEMTGAPHVDAIVGRTIDSIVDPAYTDLLKERRKRIARGETLQPVEVLVRRFDGDERYVVLHSVLVTYHGRPALQVVARDVTERKKAQDKLRESHRFLQETINAIPAHIAVLDENGVILEVNQAWRQFAKENGGFPEKTGPGVNYLAVCDAAAGRNVTPAHEVAAAIRDVIVRRRTDFEIEYPCPTPEKQLWFNLKVTRFSGDGPARIVTMHEDVTERRKAAEELRQKSERLKQLSNLLIRVQEEERRHIARELHDEAGQILTGLTLVLESGLRSEGPPSKVLLEEAMGLSKTLLKSIRNLSLDLRPAMLDDFGLVPALEAHIERFSKQTGVEIELTSAGTLRRLPGLLEITAFRVVQEALTNVVRHAHVQAASVHVSFEPDRLVLQITDRGEGFEVSPLLEKPVSSGLSGMKERVNLAGGSLEIDSTPGTGTRVQVVLPYV